MCVCMCVCVCVCVYVCVRMCVRVCLAHLLFTALFEVFRAEHNVKNLSPSSDLSMMERESAAQADVPLEMDVPIRQVSHCSMHTPLCTCNIDACIRV